MGKSNPSTRVRRNIPLELQKETKLSVDIPLWLKERYKNLRGYMKHHIINAMEEYLDRKTATEAVEDFLMKDGKKILTKMLEDIDPTKPLKDLTDRVEQTVAFVEAEARGPQLSIEIATTKNKIKVLQAIANDRPIPGDAMSRVGLDDMIHDGIVERDNKGNFRILPPKK